MKFAGWYGIILGLLMMGMWIFFLVNNQVTELQTEPFRISFHLAGEFATAICLIIGGVGLLRNRTRSEAVYLVATGMVLYSLVVSPGYYAQLGQWGFVVMFAIFVILTIFCMMKVVRVRG